MRTPLQKGEKILLVNYTSWITLIVPALITIIFCIVAYFIPDNTWRLIVILAGLLIFLYKFWEWKVDIWVVTNYRVIDESGLLSHFAKESPLEKINNVSYDQHIWGRIFNFGHVEIQTAAEVGATDYYNVSHPKRLKDTITLAQSDYKSIQLTNQAQQMASALNVYTPSSQPSYHGSHNIASELEKLVELKQKGILTEEEYVKAKNKLIS